MPRWMKKDMTLSLHPPFALDLASLVAPPPAVDQPVAGELLQVVLVAEDPHRGCLWLPPQPVAAPSLIIIVIPSLHSMTKKTLAMTLLENPVSQRQVPLRDCLLEEGEGVFIQIQLLAAAIDQSLLVASQDEALLMTLSHHQLISGWITRIVEVITLMV